MQNIMLKIFVLVFLSNFLFAQEIPSIYSNLGRDKDGKLYVISKDGKKIYETPSKTDFKFDEIFGNPRGTVNGVAFDFGENFNGKLYYGFIPENDSKFPQPVFLWKSEKIKNGKAEINMVKWMRGIFDVPNWEKYGKATIGYRALDAEGHMILDSRINVLGKSPFSVAPTIIEGPFVTNVTENSATVWFRTNKKTDVQIALSNGKIKKSENTKFHVFIFENLEPAKKYNYKITYGKFNETGSFRTANKKGDRTPFVFSYASDSRNSSGGGERDIYGANVYILKKILAVASAEDSRFMQFTGDLIDGNTSSLDNMKLQYYNWKYAAAPFGKYFPLYVTMGNHEDYVYIFKNPENKKEKYVFDKFPFENNSSEFLFANEFVMPVSDLKSEDGAKYDPNPDKIDFPSYDETVYYYVYGNVAMVVLNSDYWYSPSVKKGLTQVGGGLHGYIMDKQLEWLKRTLEKLDADPDIDHIFVTQHTPAFPNGGHVVNAMWYYGNNERRPYIAGKPLEQGVIERRDEYLNIVVNQTKKVRAILTGDEHNYSRTLIDPGMNMYPKNWSKKKLEIKRKLYQINNGAAGAPYYVQEKTPWSDHVKKFTTQNAIVLFYVNGKKVHVKVKNPDTLELIEEYDLY